MPQPLNPTIFILEDDPDIAGLLKHHLQPAGYGVSWFPRAPAFSTKCMRVAPHWSYSTSWCQATAGLMLLSPSATIPHSPAFRLCLLPPGPRNPTGYVASRSGQ